MPRKSISGFAEAGATMAQQLDDNDLLNLFSAIGRVVSKRQLAGRLRPISASPHCGSRRN
jgi:hypothetical protein